MKKKLKQMKIDDKYVIKLNEEVIVKSNQKHGKIVFVQYLGMARRYTIETDDGFTVYLFDKDITFVRPEALSAQGIDGLLLTPPNKRANLKGMIQ